MASAEETQNGIGFVRWLAGRGQLAAFLRTASDEERKRLRIAAYELVWRLVFQRLTRGIETRRGHRHCASSINRLEPECLDRFHDDVEAVLDDLFANAKVPIVNLEGWLTRRLTAATVDAHRRRRGERGALQKPRLPSWLVEALGRDPWLMELAVEMLVWVGVQATAGMGLWPLTAWAERRAAVTGDYEDADRAIAADVGTALAAMRRRPLWYARYVERPLGRKPAPALLWHRSTALPHDPPPLRLVEPHEADDARLLELAAAAIDAIRARAACGEDVRAVVVDVLGTVFGAGTGAENLDRVPGDGSGAPERVVALAADPATLDRIVATVLDLLAGDRG